MNNTTTRLTQQIEDMFIMVRSMYRIIEVRCCEIPEEDSGFSEEDWAEAGGGFMVLMDCEGRVLGSGMVGNPAGEWFDGVHDIAHAKCRKVLETCRATCFFIDHDADMYAGGIPIVYNDPIDGTEKIGALAFSGLPEWADHALVVAAAAYGRMNIDRETHVDVAVGRPAAQVVFEEAERWAA